MNTNKTNEDGDKPREGVRLIVGNIKYTSKYDALVQKLGEFAKILDLHLPPGADGMQNKGYALFRVAADHVDALLKANVVLDERILRVQRAL